MKFRTSDELLAEISNRLVAYCEAADDPDCFSGRLTLSISVKEVNQLSVTSLLDEVRELFPPSRPSSVFRFTVRDRALGKDLFLFYYRRESGVFILEPDQPPKP